MTIDWINFTPWTALAGGVLIGAAAGLFVLLNGRIAGISGLLASLLERGLLAAGLLVGFGTRYGSGCTSGHGVCGISRLSPRSVVATLAFMAAGFATVFVLRHLLGG
jgi:hypothetical protein